MLRKDIYVNARCQHGTWQETIRERLSPPRNASLRLIASERDVQRPRLAVEDRDVGEVVPVAVLANLQAMQPRSELHLETLAVERAFPRLAVDPHLGIDRLDAHRQLAEALGCGSRDTGSGIRCAWVPATDRALRRGSRIPWPGSRVLRSSSRIRRSARRQRRACRPRRFRLSRRQGFHRVTDVERATRLNVNALLVRPMARQVELDIVIARLDVQPLEDAVEIVDRSRVVTVDEDFGLPRRDLRAHVAGQIVAGVSPVGRELVIRPAAVVTPVVPAVPVIAAIAVVQPGAVQARIVEAADEDRRPGANDDRGPDDYRWPNDDGAARDGDTTLGFGVRRADRERCGDGAGGDEKRSSDRQRNLR